MIDLSGPILGVVEYDTKNHIVIADSSTSSTKTNLCDGSDQISRDTFLPHMQRMTLEVTMSTVKVLSDSAQVLPCALVELGCETTSLDLRAYIWDYTDNCIISVLRTEYVNMVKQGTKGFIISGPDSKFVFQFKTNPQKHCGKPTDFYPFTYDSLHVAIFSGGLDLRSGRNLSKERNGATKFLQYTSPTENTQFFQFFAYDPKHPS